jgi:hypothetical protein
MLPQRGCGGNEPHASDPGTDLTGNTTDYLDMEQSALLRWTWRDGSSQAIVGTTLALARNGIAVAAEMILFGMTSVGCSPRQWQRFRNGRETPIQP